MKLLLIVGLSLQLICTSAFASDTITAEPEGDAYNYVSLYEVLIDAQAEEVWPILNNLGAWMYEFEMAPVSGDMGKEGQILQLYPGQDFMVQITKAVPNKLLVVANLPSTFREEASTGVAVITLHGIGDKTAVSMTMSRRYTWLGDGDNPMKAMRASQQFSDNGRAMWQDRFLGKLKALVEVDTP